MVLTAVAAGVAAAAEDALLLRVWSRTRRPVPGPPSCPTQCPRVQGPCGWCGRRGMATTA
jgi:hypothetical protein